MSLTDGQILLRVYLRTADRSPHVPTWELLVRAARKGGLAGATVLQGIVGLGSRGFARQSNWTLVQQVPVIVEIVDDAASIGAFVRGPMNELMRTGMATLE